MAFKTKSERLIESIREARATLTAAEADEAAAMVAANTAETFTAKCRSKLADLEAALLRYAGREDA